MAKHCTHLNEIKITKPSKHVCEDCVKMGDSWVHLRMCLDAAMSAAAIPRRISTPPSIFTQPHHPLMRSIEPGERWIWCYVDEIAPGELES